MATPHKIGRYTIKKKLGQGGMASVFLADDPNFGREVAVKVLPSNMIEDPMFRARFNREARTIATLEHSAIVPVYDFGEQDGQPFLVMRFMRGGSLQDKLMLGPLDLKYSAEITKRLASALDAAHAKGIIHRDLKPANILFDENDDAYLSDFGIVKLAEETATLATKGIIGTPAYMSPEQVDPDRKIDPRSDIYTLGIIVYEMLTGRLPYESDTPAKLMMAHLTKPAPRIQLANPQLPDDSETIIAKAMAKRATDRYQSATALASDVTTLANRGKLAAAPRTVLVPEKRPVRTAPSTQKPAVKRQQNQPAKQAETNRLPLFLLGGLAALVLLVGGLFASGILGGDGGDPTPTTVVVAAVTDTLAPVVNPTDTPTIVSIADTPEIVPTDTEVVVDPATNAPEIVPTDTTEPATNTPIPPTDTPVLPTVEPEFGATKIDGDDGMVQLFLPSSQYLIGSIPSDIPIFVDSCTEELNGDPGNICQFDDELPQHSVFLDGFWVDQFEVSTQQYANFLNQRGTHFDCFGEQCIDLISEDEDSHILLDNGVYEVEVGFESHPIVEVSWYGAAAYCDAMGRRIPTEAEWEAAARGDAAVIFPWGNEFDGTRVNYCDETCTEIWADDVADGFAQTAAVGSFPSGRNALGAFDMAGNVWEWTFDWYDGDFYANSPDANPRGPSSGETKVVRGGSYFFNATFQRTAARNNLYAPTDRFDILGFRCVEANPIP